MYIDVHPPLRISGWMHLFGQLSFQRVQRYAYTDPKFDAQIGKYKFRARASSDVASLTPLSMSAQGESREEAEEEMAVPTEHKEVPSKQAKCMQSHTK